MLKTFRISFALKNTYRVNTILYAIKQIPLLKKILPEYLYRVQGFKIFANVISVIYEIISAFIGKLIYFLVMFMLPMSLYKNTNSTDLFLHILLFLSIIGSFANIYMFDESKDRYYALMSLSVDAKKYTLCNYFYEIFKVLVFFSVFGLIFGSLSGLQLWQCLMIPLFVAGIKLSVIPIVFFKYMKKGQRADNSLFGKLQFLIIFVFLTLAYGLPYLSIVIPSYATIIVMSIFIIIGLFSIKKILSFGFYREVYREILTDSALLKTNSVSEVQKQSHKIISNDTKIHSKREGFEYLNELFIKRHHRILWKSIMYISAVCLLLLAVMIALTLIFSEFKTEINQLLKTSLPYFLFIMYAINRGMSFTRCLFINCDHSLLTYSFYKKPNFILKLFQIRLREIIKINLLPAVIIGTGLASLLYLSGGTDNPIDYAVYIVSIICLSVFFSVHNLTIYYLLQPYNAGTEIKSGMYQLIMSATYFVCYFMMQMELPTIAFGLTTILFCILYCIVACILVYKLAPKTFRIRS